MFTIKTLRIISTTLLLALCFALLTACGNGGTPPVVTLNGTDIIVGASKVSALAGFDTSLPGSQVPPMGNLDARSYLKDFLVVRQDGTNYAYSYIYNPERASQNIFQCVIYKVTLYSPVESSWSEDSLINGVNFWGLDAEGIKQAMSEYKLKRESDASLSYTDGGYTYFFMLNEDGSINYITVEMPIK